MTNYLNQSRNSNGVGRSTKTTVECATAKHRLRGRGVLKICLMFLFTISTYVGRGQCTYNPNWTFENETCLDYNDGFICCAPSPGPLSNYTCSIAPVAGTQVGHCFFNLPPGTYTVTITETTTQCQTPSTFTIVANNYPAIVINPNPTPSCGNNGIACVNITGGSGSFNIDWFTDQNLTNYISSGTCTANNLAPGTYYYRLEDTTPNVPFSECVNTGPVVVAGSPAFTFLGQVIGVPCATMCTGQIQLDLTGVMLPASVSWTGPTSGITNNVNTYNYNIINACQGTYAVMVTDANGCTSNQNFAIGISTNDIIINGCANPIWNSAFFNGLTDVTMPGNVIVMPGACLQIQNMTIRFKAGKHLEIRSTASLNADSSTFDVGCGDPYWDGIRVNGVAGHCDAQNLRGALSIDHCIITHALVGTANGTPNSTSINTSDAGGRITAANCTWIDNLQDMRIANYAAVINATTNQYSVYADFCNFIIANAPVGTFTLADNRVSLGSVNDARFHHCNMLNNLPAIYLPNAHPQGLGAGNSQFQWIGDNQSIISGFSRGIYSTGSFANPACTQANWSLCDVTESTFNCITGILFSNANSVQILGNTLDADPAGFATNAPHIGIQVDAGSAQVNTRVFIARNAITYITQPFQQIGIQVNNCKGNSNYVLDNDIDNCDVGLNLMNRNRVNNTANGGAGLHFECNTFNTCTQDVNVACSGTNCGASVQGIASVQAATYSTPFGPTWPISAYNAYSNSAANGNNDDVQARTDQVVGFSYRYHTNDYNVANLTALVPHEMSQNTNPFPFNAVTLLAQPGTILPDSTFCDSIQITPPTLPIIQINFDDGKEEYLNMRALYKAMIDGGDTEGLRNNVLYSSYSQAYQLYLQLLSQSPALSDEVMIAAIQEETDIPASLLTIILAANPSAAKNPEIFKALTDRNNPLDAYQMSQIMLGRLSTSPKELMEQDMGFYMAGLDKAYTDALVYFQNNPATDAISTLEGLLLSDIVFEHRRTLAELHLMSGDVNYGYTLMQNLADYFELGGNADASLEEYADMLKLQREIAGREGSPLTNAEKQYLIDIINADPCGNGPYAHQMMVHYAGHSEELPACIELRSMRMNGSATDAASTVIYPNPAESGFAMLQLVAPCTQATAIELHDVQGKLLNTWSLLSGQRDLPMQLNSLPAGAYIVSIRGANTTEHLSLIIQ